MEYVKWVAKAIIAAAIAFLSVLAGVIQSGHHVDGGTYVTAALAAIVALGGTFGISNGPKPTGKL